MHRNILDLEGECLLSFGSRNRGRLRAVEQYHQRLVFRRRVEAAVTGKVANFAEKLATLPGRHSTR